MLPGAVHVVQRPPVPLQQSRPARGGRPTVAGSITDADSHRRRTLGDDRAGKGLDEPARRRGDPAFPRRQPIHPRVRLAGRRMNRRLHHDLTARATNVHPRRQAPVAHLVRRLEQQVPPPAPRHSLNRLRRVTVLSAQGCPLLLTINLVAVDIDREHPPRVRRQIIERAESQPDPVVGVRALPPPADGPRVHRRGVLPRGDRRVLASRGDRDHPQPHRRAQQSTPQYLVFSVVPHRGCRGREPPAGLPR